MSSALSLRARRSAQPTTSPPKALCGDAHGALARLRTRLRSMSDRPELLYDLMGFGLYQEMAVTRDGMLIARPKRGRSPGFDVFLGRVTTSMRQRTAQIWRELEPAEKTLVLVRLTTLGIPPEAIGIVVD